MHNQPCAALIGLVLIAACGSRASSTGPTTRTLVWSFVNQSSGDTLKVESGAFYPPETTLVMPGKSACLDYGGSFEHPLPFDSFAAIVIYPKGHSGRWFLQPSWGVG